MPHDLQEEFFNGIRPMADLIWQGNERPVLTRCGPSHSPLIKGIDGRYITFQVAEFAMPRSLFREIWANGLPSACRSPKSGHRMAAEGMQSPWRWNGGMISLNLDDIWEMSA